jgi:predicted flap endonuclease-1-like 5' DNA nuclease|tara:strand:- start:5231 stop:6289 length:1059 start_codon:yes stop_codon:yes gene_type:complete
MSIPEGICVDLETTLSGRVPDTVRPKGQKRLETRVLEIGASCWHKKVPDYQVLVNPLHGMCLETPEDMFAALRDMHQRPDATIGFWAKVLARRAKTLTPAMLNGMAPEIWERCTVKNKARDFLRWFNGGKGPEFKPEGEALAGLLEYTRKCGETTWLAHNGRSFDFKILQGVAERNGLTIDHVQQADTLHIFRKIDLQVQSYSQPKLYASLGLGVYNAHVAIDDARALAKICQHVSSKGPAKPTHGLAVPVQKAPAKPTGPPYQKPAQKAMMVMDIKGIGPKSRDALLRLGIRTTSQLKAHYDQKGVDWLRRALPRGVRWRVVCQSLALVHKSSTSCAGGARSRVRHALPLV